MQHGEIPAHLHFHALNPNITAASVQVPRTLLPWPGEGPRVAGVSSFGFSGTNAHVVIEHAAFAATPAPAQDTLLLPLSARTAEGLARMAASYAARISGEFDIADVCYTASVRRAHYSHRLALTGTTAGEMARELEVFARGELSPAVVTGVAQPGGTYPIVFVFSGHGGQWPGMALDLIASEPVFRASIDESAEAMRPYLDVHAALRSPDRIGLIQPALFAVQVALAALFRSWGIVPAAVLGHSCGEVAAAYVAGLLTLQDAVHVICSRSSLLDRIAGRGGMALVELSESEAGEMIAGDTDHLSIGALNGPRTTVIAGDPEALNTLLARIAERGVFGRRVDIDFAAHSPQVEPLLAELAVALKGIVPVEGAIPLYSTVTGEVVDGPELDAHYWTRNLRKPVRLWPAVERIAREGHSTFLEIGPHPLLVAALREGLQTLQRDTRVLPSMRRHGAARPVLLNTLGGLYTAGAPVNWSGLYPSGGRSVSLPAYAWQRERFWVERTAAAAPRNGHPLMGEGWRSSIHPGTNFWETTLRADSVHWLRDHRVEGTVVMPAAAYAEMALAAAAEALGDGAHAVEGLSFEQPLMLTDGAAVAMQVVLESEAGGTLRFRCSSRDAAGIGQWTLHANGVVRAGESEAPAAPVAIAEVQSRCGTTADAEQFYETSAARGLEYGPAFQGVQQLWRRDGEALARLRLPAQGRAYRIHPALLDAGLQVFGAALADTSGAASVPVAMQSLRIVGDCASIEWAHATATGDVLLLDGAGQVVVEVRGIRVQRIAAEAAVDDGIRGMLYSLDWEARERAVTSPPAAGRWVIAGDADEVIAAELRRRGATVVSSVAFSAAEPCRAIVYCSNATTPDAAVATAERVLTLVQKIVETGWRDAPRLWLLTRDALADSTLWGLGRSIALEHADLRCTMVAAGDGTTTSELVDELMADDIETQVSLEGGLRRVARLTHLGEQAAALAPAGDRPFRLEIEKPGVLDHLALTAVHRRRPGCGRSGNRSGRSSAQLQRRSESHGIVSGSAAGSCAVGQ